MSIIHAYISSAERRRLTQKDNTYFRRQLAHHTILNHLLNRPVYKQLLAELLCVLDNRPIARRKTEQSNSNVSVYKDGELIRIEHSNGRAMKV